MFAYLGLSSQPAQVQSITANRVTLKSDDFYSPGLWTLVEFVNAARTFRCVVFVRAEHVHSHGDGGYTWDAELSRPLTAVELRRLRKEDL
jgi:hypothetical protein